MACSELYVLVLQSYVFSTSLLLLSHKPACHHPSASTSSTASCLSACFMFSFVTQSSLVTTSTFCKYLISSACSLLSCLFCSVHALQPYNNVGRTIVLYTLIFVDYLSSLLFNTYFLIAPTTLNAAPILFSI